jgi:hypothetical protein
MCAPRVDQVETVAAIPVAVATPLPLPLPLPVRSSSCHVIFCLYGSELMQ